MAVHLSWVTRASTSFHTACDLGTEQCQVKSLPRNVLTSSHWSLARESGASGEEEEEEEETGPVIPFFRLDGETKIQERQRMIDLFNDPGCVVKTHPFPL